MTDSDKNPFVGPDAIPRGQKIFGRPYECKEIIYSVLSEGVLLLHSPSGAGKTSIINAGVLDFLEKEEKFNIVEPFRVKQLLSNGTDIESIKSVLTTAIDKSRGDQEADSLMVFDQFEELVFPEHTFVDGIDASETLATAIGQFLTEREDVFAIISVREDFLAQIEALSNEFPTRLKNKFRLGLFSLTAAEEVIQGTFVDAGYSISKADVKSIVENLSLIKVENKDGTFSKRTSNYVEPIHLQLVGSKLWNDNKEEKKISLAKYSKTGFDIDEALIEYFDATIRDICADSQFSIAESELRAWFSEYLISGKGFRAQVRRGEQKTKGLDNEIVKKLVSLRIIRNVPRQDIKQIELAHDRLVDPITISNTKWYENISDELYDRIRQWRAEGKPNWFLPIWRELRKFESWKQQKPHAAKMVDADAFIAAAKTKEKGFNVGLSATGIFLIAVLAFALKLVMINIELDGKNIELNRVNTELSEERDNLLNERGVTSEQLETINRYACDAKQDEFRLMKSDFDTAYKSAILLWSARNTLAAKSELAIAQQIATNLSIVQDKAEQSSFWKSKNCDFVTNPIPQEFEFFASLTKLLSPDPDEKIDKLDFGVGIVVGDINHNGSLLAMGGYEGTAGVFDIRSDELKKALLPNCKKPIENSNEICHEDETKILNVHFQGDYLFTADDGANGRIVQSSAFSNDGPTLTPLAIFDLNYKVLSLNSGSVQDKIIIAAGGSDGYVTLLVNDNNEKMVQGEPTPIKDCKNVTSVSFTDDMQILAIACEDQAVYLCDIVVDQSGYHLDGVCPKTLGKTMPNNTIAFGPKNFEPIFDVLAVGGKNGELLLRAKDDVPKRMELSKSDITDLAFLEKGRVAISLADGQIIIVAYEANCEICDKPGLRAREVMYLQAHQESIASISTTPEGALYALGVNGTLSRWSSDQLQNFGSSIFCFTDDCSHKVLPLSVAIHSKPLELNGAQPIFVGTTYGKLAGFDSKSLDRPNWTLDAHDPPSTIGITEELVELLPGSHPNSIGLVTTVNISPDGKLIATSDYDGQIKLWEIEDILEKPRKKVSLKAHKGKISSVQFLANTLGVISSGYDGNLVVSTGKNNWTPSVNDSPFVRLASESNDINHLVRWNATDTYEDFIAVTNYKALVTRVDLESSKPALHKILNLNFDSKMLRAIRTGNDSIAFAGFNGILALGSLDHFKQLIGHTKAIDAVAMVTDDSIATVSRDGTLRIWSISAQSLIVTIPLPTALSDEEGPLTARDLAVHYDKDKGWLFAVVLTTNNHVWVLEVPRLSEK